MALAATSLCAVALLGTRAAHVWHAGIHTIDQAMEFTIEVAAVACAAWLAVGAVVGLICAVATRTGRTWSAGHALLARCAPVLVRRLAGVAITASIGIGVTAPAALAASPDPANEDRPSAGVVVDLGWRPTAPAAPAETAEAAEARQDRALNPPPDDRRIVVSRGDTLWSIAATHLARVRGEDDNGPARVAREVAAWYAANRSAIGPDPDLVHPGTVLRPPAAPTESGAPAEPAPAESAASAELTAPAEGALR